MIKSYSSSMQMSEMHINCEYPHETLWIEGAFWALHYNYSIPRQESIIINSTHDDGSSEICILCTTETERTLKMIIENHFNKED